MTAWAYVENIVSIIGIVLIVIFAPDWWKLMALLVFGYMNYTRKVAK